MPTKPKTASKRKPPGKKTGVMTDFHRRFADEYLVDGRAGPAYRRAKGQAKDPYSAGAELLRYPHIRAYIAKRQQEMGAKLEISAENVLKRWWELATTDVNEIIQHRRRACRWCYGEKHRYHWIDEEEWQEACRKAEQAEKPRPVPSNEGGYGYQRSADPHPDCPRCDGEGEASVYIADTRRMSPQAKALYAGIKTTKEGTDVKTQDQGKALENVARHLGMLDSKFKLGLDEDDPLASLVRAIASSGRGSTLAPQQDEPGDEPGPMGG